MTDYNDGRWHDAAGLTEWPTDAKSMVERVWEFAEGTGTGRYDYGPAETLHWGSAYGKTVSFRVVKPSPPEPREWWLTDNGCWWETYEEASSAYDDPGEIIHVREVTETPTQGD
jgi:hypothetical protein